MVAQKRERHTCSDTMNRLPRAAQPALGGGSSDDEEKEEHAHAMPSFRNVDECWRSVQGGQNDPRHPRRHAGHFRPLRLRWGSHDNVDMSAAFADESGTFPGESWRIPARNFRRISGERLFIGDMNGDDRDYLVCNNISSGVLCVDEADEDGRYTGSNWSQTRRFCDGTANRMRIGYFNGDPRADLVCTQSDGTVRVDLANNFGEFWTTTGRW